MSNLNPSWLIYGIRFMVAVVLVTTTGATAWGKSRVGVAVNALPSRGLAFGPQAAIRLDVPAVGFHLDLNGLYEQGPDSELVETIQLIDDGQTNCSAELPNFWSGQTTLDARAAVGVGIVHIRGGVSTSIQRGIPDRFMKQLVEECSISVDGPSHNVSAGPSLGVAMDFGPIETTVDVSYRTGVIGTDPYKWGDPPSQDQWVRAARDYVNPTLELPVRSMVVVGPLYFQASMTLGIDFPTENSRLWQEQFPDSNAALDIAFRSELALTLGVSF